MKLWRGILLAGAIACACMARADDSIAVAEEIAPADSVFGTVAVDTFMVNTDSATMETLAKTDSVAAKDSLHRKPPIYQGTLLKFDIAMTVIELAMSKGKIQTFEGALSWRLKNRFYPTFEFGGANAVTQPDSVLHRGAGGFFRAGVDINGLRRHPESLSAVLVGVRVGTSMQSFELPDYGRHFKADCWGEVVAGCQVDIYKGFLMGWNVRFRALFTRKAKDGEQLPLFIPGFGHRDDTAWGFNYYVGYKF